MRVSTTIAAADPLNLTGMVAPGPRVPAVRNRRVVAIDEERGLVFAEVYFDHDAALRSYALKDGRTVTVRNAAPWTWCINEIFEVNGAGEISQVEAVLLSVPYGMRPAWSTGIHLPSPQAQRDGFKEY